MFTYFKIVFLLVGTYTICAIGLIVVENAGLLSASITATMGRTVGEGLGIRLLNILWGRVFPDLKYFGVDQWGSNWYQYGNGFFQHGTGHTAGVQLHDTRVVMDAPPTESFTTANQPTNPTMAQWVYQGMDTAKHLAPAAAWAANLMAR